MIVGSESQTGGKTSEDLSQIKDLQPTCTPGARVISTGMRSWRFEIPAGPRGGYRLAQLDNYGSRPRRNFPLRAPMRIELEARVSHPTIPGTWGFGLWNNPFGMAILRGVELLRLPALPEAAWFFFAAPPNYLSLRDDLPAQGWLAATFRSSGHSGLLLPLGAVALPLLVFPQGARALRRLARRFVLQSASALPVDPTSWRRYALAWDQDGVCFSVDGEIYLEGAVSPSGPLGLVLWLDNQFAAFPPDGRLRFGTLPNPEPAWMELRDFSIEPGV